MYKIKIDVCIIILYVKESDLIMPVNCKVYKILISCPSDVKDEVEIINKVIQNFNNTIGNSVGTLLQTFHWSTSVYPEQGDRPQELINKQIVGDCDILIGVFLNRFGSSTGKYDSGTVEEIKEMIDAGKQVFLYFSDKPIRKSEIDPKQEQKIQNFKDEYKDQGIYYEYSSDEDFESSLTKHLNLYLLKNITQTNSSENHNFKSKLIIKSLNEHNSLSENLCYSNFKDFNIVSKEEIGELFNEIKNVLLPLNNVIDNDKPTNNSIHFLQGISVPNELLKLNNPVKAKVTEDDRRLIIDYAHKNSIDVNETEFFYLGNLKEKTVYIYEDNLIGEESEKDKYHKLYALIVKIKQYEETNTYKRYLGKLNILQLAVVNEDVRPDKDIIVRLYIPKSGLLNYSDIEYPSVYIFEEITNIINDIYKNNDIFIGNNKMYEFEYPLSTRLPKMPYLDLPGFNHQDRKEKIIEEYSGKMQDLYNTYEMQENDSEIIVSFEISSLNQNTGMWFPCHIILKDKIEELKYTINSSGNSEIIEKTLSVNK